MTPPSLPGRDMEEWRSVVGLEGRYAVSSLGRVYSERRDRVLTPVPYSRGHLKVSLAGKLLYVHRLVLLAFRGPCPPGHESGHLDGDPTHNELDNLAWVTRQENADHRTLHGTQPIGERNPAARLTAAGVQKIRNLVASGLTQTATAQRCGVSLSTVHGIITRRYWAHV